MSIEGFEKKAIEWSAASFFVLKRVRAVMLSETSLPEIASSGKEKARTLQLYNEFQTRRRCSKLKT